MDTVNLNGLKKMYVAGGCFWCTEADLRKVTGVAKVTSGYSGGRIENPTYEQVVSERTGHRESVEIVYDPQKVSYDFLLRYFFEHIDPTDAGGQFHDRGESYTTAIFVQNEEEKQIAENIIKELDESGVYEGKIATKILPFTNFYPAEDYHQNYSSSNPAHYGAYRSASGRDIYVGKICSIKTGKKLPIISDSATTTQEKS